jgi:hypothetical protein
VAALPGALGPAKILCDFCSFEWFSFRGQVGCYDFSLQWLLTTYRYIAPYSWTFEEYQIENGEHRDNADIGSQPFPESVSEEHEIYANDDGDHRRHVKHDSHLSARFYANPHFEFSKLGLGWVAVPKAVCP